MDDSHLLDDQYITDESSLVEASKGKRFANYLVDYFVASIIGNILSAALIGVSAVSGNSAFEIFAILSGIFFYIGYYVIMEHFMNGKTIGKYVTGTRVVMVDGSKPDGNTIVLRTLSRIVPFEPFSFLGENLNGWHDRWTKTMVIDEKLSTIAPDHIW